MMHSPLLPDPMTGPAFDAAGNPAPVANRLKRFDSGPSRCHRYVEDIDQGSPVCH